MEIAKTLIEAKVSKRRTELVEGNHASPTYYDDVKITYFNQVEYARLRENITDPYYQVFFRFLYETAARIEEARTARFSDVDFVARSITMLNSKQRRRNTARLVYLSPELITALLLRQKTEGLSDDDYILARHPGTAPVSRQAFSVFLKDLCVQVLGVKSLSTAHPHSLRHSRAIHLAQNGVPFTQIHKLLGHRSIQNTLIYQQFANHELKDAADKTNAIIDSL